MIENASLHKNILFTIAYYSALDFPLTTFELWRHLLFIAEPKQHSSGSSFSSRKSQLPSEKPEAGGDCVRSTRRREMKGLQPEDESCSRKESFRGGAKRKAGDLTVAIQGYGNSGEIMAQLCFEAGYRVVAVSDSRGGIYNPAGLNIKQVSAHKKKKGDLKGFAGSRNISNGQLLSLDVDVLVPAALENQITQANAGKIKADYVVELANGPTTPEADKILHRRKVTVLPDVLANAGGVIVSYFEYVQNLKGQHWKREEVLRKLKTKITGAYRKVLAQSKKYRVNLRTAAYIVALENLEKKKPKK